MEDKKDKSERLRYLNGEKEKQLERKKNYLQQIEILKRFLFQNKKEIKYNQGWIVFHKESAGKHEETIKESVDLDERQEQEEKLHFHVNQIENHHEKYIHFHKAEIEFIEKEVKMYEEGIQKCDNQINFLNKKIEENS